MFGPSFTRLFRPLSDYPFVGFETTPLAEDVILNQPATYLRSQAQAAPSLSGA
jgi:hypothetical protein